MNVASLQLCKELYELSGWIGTHGTYTPQGEIALVGVVKNLYGELGYYPAYDLGYLLRKLEDTPTTDPDIQDEPAVIIQHSGVVKPEYKWCAKVFNGDWYEKSSTTPEDAACKLAIELFKRDILTTNTKKEEI